MEARKKTSLVQAVFMHAKKYPEKLCLAEGDVTLSYGDYWKLIAHIASSLKKRGLKKGERVVVLSSNSIPLTASGLGIQLSGGVFVPVEKNIPDEDFRKILEATEAKYILTSNTLPATGKKNTISLEEIFSEVSAVTEDEDRFLFPEETAIAEILYTTGTTGERKGVVLSHRNVVAVAENIMYGVEMKPDNIELLPVSITHSYGLRSYYASMLNGSSTVFINGIAVLGRFFSEIENRGVTSLALVPAVINMILKLSGDRLGKYAGQIDYVQSGSSALTEEAKEALARLLPRSRLYNFYGSTEAGRCCVLDYSKEPGRVSCIGKPARNASFKVVDEHRKELPPSKENVGFLACRGDMTMQGYWKDPEGTSRTLADGILYTNDLVYMSLDGYIYYAGRKDDVINTGGVKIIPSEIEAVALRYPDVAECICVPMEDDLLGQAPCLCVVMKQEKSLSEEDILAFLSRSLDGERMPRVIRQIEAVPRTYNGKPDRKSVLFIGKRPEKIEKKEGSGS